MDVQAARVKIVQTESERLKQYLAALPTDAWTTPSACTLWEVRDVVAHLIVAANLYIESLTRGLQGNTSAPPGRPDPRTFTTASPAERQQRARAAGERILALRTEFGTDLLDVFSTTWDQFQGLVATLNPHDWHIPCYHPRGVVPARVLVNLGVFELAIHGWDICSVREPVAHLSPEALPVILEFYSTSLPWFFIPDTKLSTPVSYRFVLTGACSSQWDIVVEGDNVSMQPATEAAPANATFRCDGETFVLLMCGRRGLDAVMGEKQDTPEGDTAAVQALTKWFQGA